MKRRTSFTLKEDKYIKDNYLKIPIKTIAKKLGRSGCGVKGRMKAMNLVVPKSIAKQRLKDSQFKPGTIPPNKGKKQIEYMTPEAIEKTKATRFKKGQKSYNQQTVGTETLRSDGYVWIKIREPRTWKLKHVHIWEQHNLNPIKKNENIIFIDGDNFNFNVENLKKVTDAELMAMNTIHRYPTELKSQIRKLSKLKQTIKTIENE